MNYYHFEESVPKFIPRKRLPGLHDSDVNDSKVGVWEYYLVTCTICKVSCIIWSPSTVWSLALSGHMYYLVTGTIWSPAQSGHLYYLVTSTIWSPILLVTGTI